MDFIELLVWVVAVAAFIVSRIVKKSRKASPDAPVAMAPVLPRPAVETASELPSGLASAEWGRDPAHAPTLPRQGQAALAEKASAAPALSLERTTHEVLPTPNDPARAHLLQAARRGAAQTSAFEKRRGEAPRRRPLFDARRDLRQAVIGATVLGPCRALAPYDDSTGVPPLSR